MYSVEEILCASFRDNPSVVYAVGESETRRRALITYSIQQARQAGRIYHADHSAAVVLFKNKKPSFIRNVIPTFNLIFKGLRSNTLRIMKKEKLIHAIHQQFQIPDDSVYLWYIGTHPAHCGNGSGSKLLAEILDEFSAKTIILETSVKKNIDWYGKFGFQVYHTEETGNSLLYFLKKDGSL